MNPLHLIRLYLRSRQAARYANAHPFAGLKFDQFGRRLGRSLLLRGRRAGMGYLLNPVSMIRYYEFAFALSCLPADPGESLDVSSPRLFSYYVAAHFPYSRIRMINPDGKDINHSARVVQAMGWRNVHTACAGADLLEADTRTYDTIWSISVIEHIAGTYDESHALRLMYGRLKPAGRLILTIPVDRHHWDEYRDQDYYGTQAKTTGGKHFFQRWYDESSIQQRILSPLGVQPSRMEWFGEIVPGRFREYEQRFIHGGWETTVHDVSEFLEHYRGYDSWHEMPGMGIAGILIQKPSG